MNQKPTPARNSRKHIKTINYIIRQSDLHENKTSSIV